MALAEYGNPWEMARSVLSGRGPATGILRNGLRITAPEIATLLGAVHEVFHDRAYTPAGFAIGRGDIVVDIGAHVGTFALMAARSGAAQVHAYEPMPSNVSILRANLAANGVSNVTVHSSAVGGRSGQAVMSVGTFSVGGSLAPLPGAVGSVAVPVVTLAGIFDENGLDRIDFLKIDCEGAEGEILTAAPPELFHRIKRIALEYHDGWSSLDHGALADLLRSVGYSVTIRPDRDPRFGYLYALRSASAGA